MRSFINLFCLLSVAILGLIGCQKPAKDAKHKFRVVCTTQMIGDTVRSLAGDNAEVVTLMGPGVDPHLYKASASDVTALRDADLVFYNGLHLEGKMTDVFQALHKGGKPVVAVSKDIDQTRLLKPPQFSGNYDPHIWFDVSLWRQASDTMAASLATSDSPHAEFYRTSGVEHAKKLDELHQWCQSEIKQIPEPRRIGVTSHDAFNYFGRAYGLEVVGLQGISTTTEAGVRDVTELVDFLKKRKVPAIFVESSVPRAAIERVSQDAGVKIGGELFSDAMGAPGTPEGSYEGMIKHNINTIVKALK